MGNTFVGLPEMSTEKESEAKARRAIRTPSYTYMSLTTDPNTELDRQNRSEPSQQRRDLACNRFHGFHPSPNSTTKDSWKDSDHSTYCRRLREGDRFPRNLPRE